MVSMKYIILGIALILLASFGRAVSLEGSCSSVGYQCDLSVKDLKVCNDSTAAETYNVTIGGEAAEWVNAIPQNLTLAAGERKQLHVYTVAECYADPGMYGVDITVSNGSSATVHCNIEIRQGHTIQVEVIPESQTATQCEEKTYNVRLTNTSMIQHQQTENVYLDITGISRDWIKLEENSLLVTKGTPENVVLKVQAPCEAKLGTYPFQAVATLVNPNFFYTDTGKYILSQGQNFGIDAAGSEVVACIGEQTTKTVTITNTGKLADTAALTLTSPSWVKLSASSLSLPPGQSKTVDLIIENAPATAGTYPITIKASSAKYGIDSTATVDILLQKCYGLVIEKISGTETACIEEPPTYVFKVTNTGTKPADAKFSISGINAELSKASAQIQPNASVNVEAKLDISGLAQETVVERTDRNVAIEIAIDTSGSMVQEIAGQSKMQIAKTATTSFAKSVSGVELGLRVFGQEALCEGSELLYDISGLDIPAITDAVNQMAPKGKTPLAEALLQSILDFPAEREKYVILVSDGKETCQGDITAAAQRLKENKIIVYAIGFDIDAEGKVQLQEIANTTGGAFYDASNADELNEVFNRIGTTLNIIPGAAGTKEFTFKAASGNASVEKAYSITAEDCKNLAVVVPAINVCKGIETDATLEVRNLGTQEQGFTIAITPSWASAEASMVLAANSAKTIPLALNPGENAQESQLKVVLTSDGIAAEGTAPISYLTTESCFGIGIINLLAVIDANACAGQIFKITVLNLGVAEQEIMLSVDKPWVYLDEKSVVVAAGERRDVYFVISPPFDMTEDQTTINITAESEHGPAASAAIKLNIFGAGFGTKKIEFSISDIEAVEISRKAGEMSKFRFTVTNDTNTLFKIYSLDALEGVNAQFTIAQDVLKAGESTIVDAEIALPDANAVSLKVPILFNTDKGSYTSEFKAELPEQTPEQPEQPEQPTGLVILDSMGGTVVAVLAAIVIVLIAYGILKSRPKSGAQAPKKDSAPAEPKKLPKAEASSDSASEDAKKSVKQAVKAAQKRKAK